MEKNVITDLIQELKTKKDICKKDIYLLSGVLKTADVRIREVIAATLGKSKRLEAVDLLCNVVIKDCEQGVRTNGAISVLDIARRYKDNKKAIRYIINKACHPLLLAGGRYGTSRNIHALGWVFMELLAIGEKIMVVTAEDRDNIAKALQKYYYATLNSDARKAIQNLLDQFGVSIVPAVPSPALGNNG
ncbi:MAG: hypothetical protein HZA78_12145 [Candidatus Schekmanbacteria bacterium]|nr:hypothetical protein [Candidatus Schekmanbacteria bacterium]